MRRSMKQTSARRQFVICVDNEGYPASLERWKVYRALPDREADAHGLVRVIDESGEDYLYATVLSAQSSSPPEAGGWIVGAQHAAPLPQSARIPACQRRVFLILGA